MEQLTEKPGAIEPVGLNELLESGALQSEEGIGQLMQMLDKSAEDINRLASARNLELSVLRQQSEYDRKQINQLQSELQRISKMLLEDPLTRVLNRRGATNAMKREISRSERTGRPFSVVLIDLDNFKSINDKYGHSIGDKVLSYMGGMLNERLRPTDIVARFGGEEFIAIMPSTDVKEGVLAMERIRKLLKENLFRSGDVELHITFSAGVVRRRDGEIQQDTFNRADAAMYLAKKSGKDRVLAG